MKGSTQDGSGENVARTPFVLAHALGGALAYWFAHLLRYDFQLPDERAMMVLVSVGPVVAVKLLCLTLLGTYRIVWRYAGVRDLRRIATAIACATAFIALGDIMLLPKFNVPRSALIIDAALTMLWVAGTYALPRWITDLRSRRRTGVRAEGTPVVIVGAGDAGELLLKEIERSPRNAMRVMRFLDDQRDKIGRTIHEIRVDGPIAEAAARARADGIEKAIIAIPTASPARLRQVADAVLRAGLSIQTLPPLEQIANASLLGRLRQLDIEDLLRRDPVRRDAAILRVSFSERTVLVTGAAGSIGSELCRQLLDFETSRVVAFDRAETPLVNLEAELKSRFPEKRLAFVLGDVTDARQVANAMRVYRPDCVFHASAVKHVPVAEVNPAEAIRVNVLGTRNVVTEATAAGVARFVLISTDKAVRPVNVMGATKRLAEFIVQTRGGISVRFGNVLGSNGSVVNIFKDQVARGGPVTVTHPDMTRFFMTIPEAVHLVLEASCLGQTEGIYILDMGQPVKIVDLARDVIRLAGLRPDADIPIVFTGVRPGERLNEDLVQDEERMAPTDHPQIVVARARPPRREQVDASVARLESLLAEGAPQEDLVRTLHAVLPEYTEPPVTSKYPAERP
jgi:FlaA1/EpsC-like NDP-sugar epimerase